MVLDFIILLNIFLFKVLKFLQNLLAGINMVIRLSKDLIC
jgi:hypothetical protein